MLDQQKFQNSLPSSPISDFHMYVHSDLLPFVIVCSLILLFLELDKRQLQRKDMELIFWAKAFIVENTFAVGD